MTKVLRRPRPRILVAVGCLLAALVVALLPVPPATTPAVAADSGAEDSAVTKSVTKSGTKGPYDDFSDLKVTVHQTKNLHSQGVRVSWEGGAPTLPSTRFNVNYLQIMQCWGDDPSGPDREQCAFGAGPTDGAGIGRTVVYGPADSGNPAAVDPAEEPGATFIPFSPANGEPPTTASIDYTYFSPLDTNEQKAVRTFANGTGETEFEVQDGIQADHLGCGLNTAPSGQTPVPRSCWLVVVPRGDHYANGTKDTNTESDALRTSPLSATNWAQRIVFRLDFQLVDSFCPEGQPERSIPGSELADDAFSLWAPKLCTSTGNNFSFVREPEDSARNEVLSATEDTPAMGVTVDPVAQSGDGPRVVHAPVSVSGLAIGFFIEGTNGVLQDMKLTPRLVAKMLTHSYVHDVPWTNVCNPSPCPPGEPAPPEYLKGNPLYYTADPEFVELNPEFSEVDSQAAPLSLMVPQGNSDTTRVIWNWLRSDKEARDFLSGEPDPWGMVVNRHYKDLDLVDNADLTDFPKSDPTVAPAINNQWWPDPVTYTILDLDPYTADLHDGAIKTRRGNNGRTIDYEPPNLPTPPKVVNTAPPPGRRIAMAIVDTASAERYGLQIAALRNADGKFVKPSVDTLQAGVDDMRPWPDNSAVLKPDPGRAEGQAYPLTVVSYAAASVNQAPKDRKAYADFMRYAAGPGQTQGRAAGQLPPGYAPLPEKLRKQAEAAADDLERGDPGSDQSSDDPDAQGSGGLTVGAGTGGISSGTGSGGAAAGGTVGGDTSSSASEAAAPNGSASPSSGPQQNIAQARQGITPGEILGVIRWVLLAVLFVAGAAGLAGPVMLRYAQRRTP
ncbi:hypothetical protein [Streptomyces brasiliensis]|uniref:PBP domain-containing protein n=1 Tax=Streptomyces brasiliensis TaxID=1954 RepID=A0A917KRN2_9ACTN|nr:hypothetical protein [Streptomyces brasiliensis]GGJ21216.1 hypothetical protein GCM10010121_035310 [Streptomyces brasiliensis]